MGQLSLMAESDRFARIDARGDPLKRINDAVDWEVFRAELNAAWRSDPPTSPAGRKPMDVMVMLKILVLGELYNLSDRQLEALLDERVTFLRYVGLEMEDHPPDEKTIWAYREALGEEQMDAMFAEFNAQLAAHGLEARGGQILDATVVDAVRQRRTKQETELLQQDQVPPSWAANPAKRRQKDADASWTKKQGRYRLGYKNHVNVDREHKLIRRYTVTPASVHDSRQFPHLLAPPNSSPAVWADKAYDSAAGERELQSRGLHSCIQRRQTRTGSLSADEQCANQKNARIRARVEHVFGAMQNEMGGLQIRATGLRRARVRIGLKNLAYNMRRFAYLQRQAGVIA